VPKPAWRRVVGVGFCAVIITAFNAAVFAAPAAAHTALQSSTPKSDARVATPPSEVVLVFTTPVRPRLSRVVVRGPDGGQYATGAPQVNSAQVVQSLSPLTAAGRYEIDFRVVAPDGHSLTDSVRFTLTKSATNAGSTPTAAGSGPASSKVATAVPVSASNRDKSGPAVWVVVLGAAAALMVVAAAVWLGRRVTRDLD
jgi:methionine-rich copper-binding protein CopC